MNNAKDRIIMMHDGNSAYPLFYVGDRKGSPCFTLDYMQAKRYTERTVRVRLLALSKTLPRWRRKLSSVQVEEVA